MPIPGHRVIPFNWSPHHRPVAAGARTANCVITRKESDGTTSSDGSWAPNTRQAIYSGSCRVIRDVADEQHPIIGDRRITTMRYLIEIAYDAPETLIGDLIAVSAPDSDADGRTFRVEGFRITTEEWSRVLLTTEFEEST